MERHLVLVGGGHAHVHVLRALAMRPQAGLRTTLVSDAATSAYSGMIPGVLAGLYARDAARIDVAALAARAGAAFVEDRVEVVRPAERVVAGARRTVAYDLLSLDVGSWTRDADGVRSDPRVAVVRPIEAFVDRVSAFADEVAAGRAPPHAAVVGAGAGGVEIAFALRRRLRASAGARVTIVERSPHLLPGGSKRVRQLVARLAPRYGIDIRTAAGAIDLAPAGLAIESGERVPAAFVAWATGAAASPIGRASGLRTDAEGFILVDAHLRALGHPEIFAVGDCARMVDHPELPRAGVYAVRQGPPLARNLRAATGREGLVRYRPQADFLSLLSTGDRRAVVSYRGLAGHGRVWWWLKDRIDRRFVALHGPPAGR